MKRLILALAIVAFLAGCASSLRVADLQRNPARYYDKTVSITGVVTSSWGIPLVPFKVYQVDDGTGSVTVVSQNQRTPIKGSRVRVTGKVSDVGVIGSRALGLHIREEHLDVKR